MLLWMLGATASADTLTLYLYPSTRHIDWESPTSLARSSLRSTLAGLTREAAMDIGHVAVSVQCDAAARWGGMSRRDKGESMTLVLRQGAGMGTLLHNFQGRLDSREQIELWNEVHAERGTLRVVDFAVTAEQCAALIEHMDVYVAGDQQHNYGLANSPFVGDGAGCSAFAASFAEVGGLLDASRRAAWSTTVYIPEDLVGRYHHTVYTSAEEPMVTPDRASPRVGFLSMVARQHDWADPSDPGTIALFFFSPDFMYDWAEAMRLQVGAPEGPSAVSPVGAGWRLSFALPEQPEGASVPDAAQQPVSVEGAGGGRDGVLADPGADEEAGAGVHDPVDLDEGHQHRVVGDGEDE
jgi:hypothetical protein